MSFTPQQLERFSDRIKNCLEDENCRAKLKLFLHRSGRKSLLEPLELWEKANGLSLDEIRELAFEIDSFNEDILSDDLNPQQLVNCVREECCRILERILPPFIQFLKHGSGGQINRTTGNRNN